MIRDADAIAIFTGAGMGVDSGLEQYRGKDGLWTQSIMLNNKPVNYAELMTPAGFMNEPEAAWGLIGNLTEKYRNTEPHEGFSILREIAFQREYFVITSNTDEQFQRAGFNSEKIFEFHGSIFRTQCGENLECSTWETPFIEVDQETNMARFPVPVCPVCNSYCRPNVYLFYDENFVTEISAEQQFRYMEWREMIRSRFSNLLALEIGAGESLPTIRRYAERFAGDNNYLIRVNPSDYETNQPNHISVPMRAVDYLNKVKNFVDI